MSACDRYMPYRLYDPSRRRSVVQWDWLAWANLSPEGERFLAAVKWLGDALGLVGLSVMYCFSVSAGRPDLVESVWIIRARPAP